VIGAVPVAQSRPKSTTMCGRIARVRDDVADEFGFVEISEKRITPRFTVATT
jgi:hypothetical protein